MIYHPKDVCQLFLKASSAHLYRDFRLLLQSRRPVPAPVGVAARAPGPLPLVARADLRFLVMDGAAPGLSVSPGFPLHLRHDGIELESPTV